ncbi:MAG: ATP-dependent helicase [Hyphomicrobiales bacterium]|nr:ATP-dependent helicase [Hyphomicrobiales bacterium]
MTVVYLDRLNERQRQAVEHGAGVGANAKGVALLVIAGAGSGKTDTLAHRVAHLIVSGIDPRRILLMTFSRRAAAEMIRRVERIARRVLADRAQALVGGLNWAGTFHGIGARILREKAAEIGVDPAFTIHDRDDAADLMNIVRHDLGFSRTQERFPLKGTCLAIYSRCVNSEQPIEEVVPQHFPWCGAWGDELKELFGAYVEAKQQQNILDYDDLILYWAQMMENASLAAEFSGRFDHVMVDEYQDTNRLQASILLRMKPDGAGLTVVGDDAQSIYSFRAATVRNILDFPDHFTPQARIVTLDQNYRSTQPILAAANGVIELAKERFTKNLWSDRKGGARPSLVTVPDETSQAGYVIERILENREMGVNLKQQAVLFRASHHSGTLELELTRRNIPFVKFGGLKFLEAAHVKDLLALLRFVENPRDRVTAFRVLLLLPGVGPKSAQAVLDHIGESPAPFDSLADVEVPSRANGHWHDLLDVVHSLAAHEVPWPAEIARARNWYEPLLERRYDDAEIRKQDLLQLEEIAAGYASRERFLTELTLDPPQATSDEAGSPLLDEDYLILSTIHSAKGQEWKSVYVLNSVDGCIPSDLATRNAAEIAEERRLLYVAMTRAKDDLHLIVPQRFYTHGQSSQGDRHVYAQRTRFIPNPLLSLFERKAWPASAYGAQARAPAQGPRVDVAARMRSMWH